MEVKISVIIPIYNMAQYLPNCLDSIVHQTLKEIEIIAVNDGSTDESLLILRKYSSRCENIVILTQKNSGAGSARNNGIYHARGRYLIFIDPDDWYPNNRCLEDLYNAAEKNKVLVCGGIIIRNDNGVRTVLDEKRLRKFYTNKTIQICDYPDIYGHQRYLFRTDLIKKNEISFPTYKRFQDPPFTVKVLSCAGEFYGLEKEVYEYRVGYKKINYSLDVCIDILQGIKDVFELVRKHNLRMIYENKLKNIYEEYIIPFYKYSFCGNTQIDKIIKEINEIDREWGGGKEKIKLTKECVYQIRKDSLMEYETLQKVLCDNKNTIIYGAGIYTRKLIELFHPKMQAVIGVAVTKRKVDSSLSGFPVREIEEYLPYRKSALVIIATMSFYQEEIEQKLKQLGFQNVLKPDMKKIELAEALLEV